MFTPSFLIHLRRNMVEAEKYPSGFDILSYAREPGADIIVQSRELATALDDSCLRRPNVSFADRHSAQLPELLPQNSMLITDDLTMARRAQSIGMGATLAYTPAGLTTSLDLLSSPAALTDQKLYERPLYTDISYREVAEELFRPGEIQVVGFVGRTGAGKSTTIDRIVSALDEIGGHGGKFEIDSFFIRTRKERKLWLNEPGISDAERVDRQRVVTWWDFDRATEALGRISQGEHVYLDNVYDMRQGGEMVGTLDMQPGEKGFTVFVEGTALLVPQLSKAIGSFIHLYSHDQVRTLSLQERNLRDGYTIEESAARKSLTDTAETENHLAYALRAACFAQSNLTVLDNTKRSDTLRLLPPYIPEI